MVVCLNAKEEDEWEMLCEIENLNYVKIGCSFMGVGWECSGWGCLLLVHVHTILAVRQSQS
jgi:hypothetical protein